MGLGAARNDLDGVNTHWFNRLRSALARLLGRFFIRVGDTLQYLKGLAATEGRILTLQAILSPESDEELAPVGVLPGVHHAHRARSIVALGLPRFTWDRPSRP